jgi:hypothetical protein
LEARRCSANELTARVAALQEAVTGLESDADFWNTIVISWPLCDVKLAASGAF